MGLLAYGLGSRALGAQVVENRARRALLPSKLCPWET